MDYLTTKNTIFHRSSQLGKLIMVGKVPRQGGRVQIELVWDRWRLNASIKPWKKQRTLMSHGPKVTVGEPLGPTSGRVSEAEQKCTNMKKISNHKQL